MLDALSRWTWLALFLASPQPDWMQLVEIPQEQHAASLELRREEQTMGQRPRIVVEGTLSHDGMRLFCQPAPKAHGSGFGLRVSQSVTFCVLRVDFTLHRLDGSKGYQRVAARVSLNGPRIEVLDVYPKNLRNEGEMAQTLAVSEAAQFLPLPGSAPRPGPFSVNNLRPIVTGYGESGSGLYWIFDAATRGPMPTGARSVFCLLGVPPDLGAISGLIEYEADIGMFILGVFEIPGTSKTRRVPFRLPLDEQANVKTGARGRS